MPTKDAHPRWNLHAAVAAWLWPGLGHIVLGQRTRGLVLMAVILPLMLLGMLVGGIFVTDHQSPPEGPGQPRSTSIMYMLGQVYLAPNVLLDRYVQRLGYPSHPADARYRPSFGRSYEQGVLLTALAGALNLLAILDVIYCDDRLRREGQPKPPAATEPGGAS